MGAIYFHFYRKYFLMPSVAIVYFSASGHTQQVAEAVARGVWHTCKIEYPRN
jgi:hypothetical protein